MSKHTPGPWMVIEDYNLVCADDRRMTIICNFPYSLKAVNNMADARLIAAAPELLDALREMIADANGEATFEQRCGLLDRARAAIRKATGEE